MEWIKTETKEPEKDKLLLFVTKPNIFHIGKFEDCFFPNNKTSGINSSLVLYWIYLKDIPLPNQPERSKREDSIHKYYYDLFDTSSETYSGEYIGRVYSLQEAKSWVSESSFRAYHEKILCKLTGIRCSDLCGKYYIHKDCVYEMRCSEHCGNTVRDK